MPIAQLAISRSLRAASREPCSPVSMGYADAARDEIVDELLPRVGGEAIALALCLVRATKRERIGGPGRDTADEDD